MPKEIFMCMAIEQAKEAAKLGEVPVGAVIVKDGTVLSCAHNLREGLKQAYAHAEMIAIERACRRLDSWRLDECELYVTMEPCPMCAGAIVQSGISSVCYGCHDKNMGAFGTVVDLSNFGNGRSVEIYGGIFEYECAAILSDFFISLREKK